MTYTDQTPIMGTGQATALSTPTLPVVAPNTKPLSIVLDIDCAATHTVSVFQRPRESRGRRAALLVIACLAQTMSNMWLCSSSARRARVMISRPSSHHVILRVVHRMINNLKIFRTIIRPNAIQVMDILCWQQAAPDQLLSNQTVFCDSSALVRVGMIWSPNPHITIRAQRSRCSWSAIVRAVAGGMLPGWGYTERFPTGGTGKIDGHRTLLTFDVMPRAGATAPGLYRAFPHLQANFTTLGCQLGAPI